MFLSLSRPRALALAAVAGFGLCSTVFLSRAAAQTVDGSPVLAPNPESVQPTPAPGTAQTDANGRHLSPRGTFYIVSYVSAKTDKGVTGFVPGQEVKFVRVNREEHKLVVSDGKTEVEVSPGLLTNDIDVAAWARQKDESNQAKIAAHLQAEEAAYRKYERELAEQTAQDVKLGEQRRVAQAAVAETAQANTATTITTAEQPATNGAVASVNNGYYGTGGYGYGNPYSYFAGETTVLNTGRRTGANNGNNPSAQGAASGNSAGATARSNGTTNPSATGTATSATAGAGTAPVNAGSATGTATSATAGAGNKGTAPSSGTSSGAAAGGRGGGRP